MMKRIDFAACGVALTILASVLHAQIPQLINY